MRNIYGLIAENAQVWHHLIPLYCYQVDKIDPKTLGYGLIVLTLSLVLRMLGTYFAVSCGNLNFKEKVFMAFAWLPKATVQAALGIPYNVKQC